MRPNLRLLQLTCALCSLTAAAHASDWPQWRGPLRTGISTETGMLKQWPAEGPKLLWKVTDLESGFSTPSVVGEALYVQTSKGFEDEFVEARQIKDGKTLWRTRIGKVGKPDQRPSYPGSRSTPTIQGQRVYALGSDGDLACLNRANGSIIWQKNVQAEFGGQAGVWAYSESPLIDGKTVIVTPGGSQATLLALNADTGAVVWKSAIADADQAGYASIIKAELGGVTQYVQFLQKGVVGVEASTGKLLWRFDRTAKNSMANIPTPAVKGDIVYTGTGQGGGGAARIKANAGKFETEELYFGPKFPRSIGGYVLVGEYLYGTYGSGLMCIDFKSGEIKWEDRCIGPASVIFADGNLILHGENGDLALVEATPEAYRLKGKVTPADQPMRGSNRAWAYPALSNGKLYIRDLNTLWCYDLKP